MMNDISKLYSSPAGIYKGILAPLNNSLSLSFDSEIVLYFNVFHFRDLKKIFKTYFAKQQSIILLTQGNWNGLMGYVKSKQV